MKLFKRALCTALCAVVLGGTLTGFAGCFGAVESSTPQTQTGEQAAKSELTLEQYSITLYEGETYTLSPKKTDGTGKAQSIETIEYASDRAYVASCENGVVTAVAAGQTYVHVTADGMSVSLFVTVKSLTNQDNVFIRFTEEQLYAGVPVQGRVYKAQNGEMTEIKAVTWSTDSEALEISATGMVTPLETTNSALVKAKCTVDGREYELEKAVSVIEPLHYTASKTQTMIATTKTYTGATNTAYTQTTLTVEARNLRTGEIQQVTGENLLPQTEESLPCSVTVETNGTVKIAAKETAGKTSMFLQIAGTTRRLKIDVDVAYAISTVADMDKLSLASHRAPTDLSLSYVLTNDIDYAGNVIYPIALWRENANRTVGAFWKYALDYADGKYSYVDRAKVGTADTGLTDVEWKALAAAKGINAANTAFSGIFDGNGYAIKNAKLMLAPFVTSPATNTYSGAGSCVFGLVNNGTVRNVEFDVSLQTPTEAMTTFGNDLSYTVLNGADLDFEWQQSQTGNYAHFSSTLIYRAQNATVYNVYSHIKLPENMYATRRSAGILGWANDTTAYNNIAFVENNNIDSKYYGIQAEGTTKYFANNLAVGAGQIAIGYSANSCGTNGNWWTDNVSFSALASLSAGSAATNALPYTQTISSFDRAIWDLSRLPSNEAPTLLNGCSVR
ncbi:MAG: hypothetical protein IJW60_05480 [Clostridia bacterium]|nr:hypothetical protein [Clostridia bacterium]